ncbi:hypothetical protein PSH66_04325 [Pseudomonas sp. FP597]|uniref:hypothetical protein n=1 Tax=Pseudomonas sp. FP597 TaxID=2954096 RepID=UPI00273513B2|nr:hypothetical protein [Pseudomonas sp. FP597]WLI07565.1 hypothetical protein PSH66_04325 [Pseudomonas sp. FP597]
MRTLNSLTQNLIESLTQLLEQPGEDALQALEVCAPVLIEELQQVLIRAVDRRDIEHQLQTALANWFRQHPQPESAEHALLEALRKQALLSPKSAAERHT